MIYDRKPKSMGLSIGDIPKEAYAVAAATLLIMIGIWAFSKPADADARLAALEAQAKQIRLAGKREGDLAVYPLGSVCGGDLDDNFKNQLNNALLNSGLKIDALDISDRGKSGDRQPLHTYGITLKASGSYEQAIGAMEVLSQYRPRLFLDSLRLRNQTQSVDLSVEGRLFCRWKQQD